MVDLSIRSILIVVSAFVAHPAAALTVVSPGSLTTTLASGRYSGVGSLGFMGANGNAGHNCTGALVSSNVVLTATHCLNGDANYKFILPGSGDYNTSGGKIFSIKSSTGLTNYLGNGVSDLAVITLAEVAEGYDHYDLYTGKDEIGKEAALVGAGLTGLMEAGFDLALTDFKVREVFNKYEATYSDFMANYYGLYGAPPPPREDEDRFIFDFDSGSTADDTFGKVFGINDLGVYHNGQLVEGGVIYGDSGGPNFIDGKLAGVNSSSGTSGYFQRDGVGKCGEPGSFDRVKPGVWGCSDGSYGDFAVSMRVSFYADAIKSYIAGAAPVSVSAVPEPSTWAMMIVGFGMVGATSRHRRRGTTAAIA